MMKKHIEEIIGCYKGEMNISSRIDGEFPLFKLNPISVRINESNNTDTHIVEACIFDLMPNGCVNMEDLNEDVCDQIEKYNLLLRSLVGQLAKRYNYRSSNTYTIDSFPYTLTEHKVYAVKIRFEVQGTSQNDCCNDFLFDVTKLPKKSWCE